MFLSVILLWTALVFLTTAPSSRVMALAPQTLYARRHQQQQQLRFTTSTSTSKSTTRIPSSNYYNNRRSRNEYSSSTTTSTAKATTTTTQLASAKILPIAYTGASGILLYKAIVLKTAASSSRLVLIAISLLSLFNFSTSDNARIKSAKIAYNEKTYPSSSGKEKQRRQAAITYRFAVRVKIIGQFLGLIRMILSKSTVGFMRGGAIIMSSQLLYFFVGGGSSNHDNEGNWKPLSDKAVTSVLCIDAILVTAALIAASASVASDTTTKLFTITSGLFAFGSFIGSLEGIPQFIKAIKSRTN
ncbi:hypothetical protein FRACYDRAFT_249235 [Fragilariopsis cylindrus CCMP1102]|uniref:Uncharacterized protein n=1 Tax=Fragilariopsis cylindrus CCMP1102 TaxID=635003 RepID=A0A1E7ES95_9STRA|nr:hypothetical protein FRACYDRAFT_249235 [Fragilariopsis cylindrus CCMP1102]|eukprot:OEU08890.1 hypothetical protein FRACYDRAFT_249235 [Fragilariopsis cylindrus CCMP1102]